jgi:hypothetical protein
MSTITVVEQTNPGAQSAGQQKIYPKAGALARVDSTGVEKVILDTSTFASTYAAATSVVMLYVNQAGV